MASMNRYKLHQIKKVRVSVLLLVAGLWLGACGEAVDTKTDAVAYFDVGKIANMVHNDLQKPGKDFRKYAVLNTLSHIDTITSIEAGAELELLKDFDINKKAWVGLFAETRADSGEYSFISYKALNEKPDVQSLAITENTLTGTLTIDGIIRKSNKIYSMEKRLTAQLRKGKFGYELHDARMQGYQKIILVDSLRFDVLYNIISGS